MLLARPLAVSENVGVLDNVALRNFSDESRTIYNRGLILLEHFLHTKNACMYRRLQLLVRDM